MAKTRTTTAVTVKLSTELPPKLRLLAARRRNAGMEPVTISGIVEEALRAWMAKHDKGAKA